MPALFSFRFAEVLCIAVKKTDPYYYQLEKYLTRFVSSQFLFQSTLMILVSWNALNAMKRLNLSGRRLLKCARRTTSLGCHSRNSRCELYIYSIREELTSYPDGETTSKERDLSFCMLSKADLIIQNTFSKLGPLLRVSMGRLNSLRLL